MHLVTALFFGLLVGAMLVAVLNSMHKEIRPREEMPQRKRTAQPAVLELRRAVGADPCVFHWGGEGFKQPCTEEVANALAKKRYKKFKKRANSALDDSINLELLKITDPSAYEAALIKQHLRRVKEEEMYPTLGEETEKTPETVDLNAYEDETDYARGNANAKNSVRVCANCYKPLHGARKTKKFCDTTCKNAYHNFNRDSEIWKK